MKKKSSIFWNAAALAGVLAFGLAGCEHGPGPVTPPPDDPLAGVMTSETANAIFGSGGWGNTAGGVEISGFKSARALAAYLGVSDSPAASYLSVSSLSVSGSVSGALLQQTPAPGGATLNIGVISGRPVVRISDRAFTPTAGDADTFISSVVTVVKLPETLRDLGTGVFSGVDAVVEIPAAAIAQIVATKGGGSPDTILAEAIGATVTIEKLDESGTSAGTIPPTETPILSPGEEDVNAGYPLNATYSTQGLSVWRAVKRGSEVTITILGTVTATQNGNYGTGAGASLTALYGKTESDLVGYAAIALNGILVADGPNNATVTNKALSDFYTQAELTNKTWVDYNTGKISNDYDDIDDWLAALIHETSSNKVITIEINGLTIKIDYSAVVWE